MRRKKIAVLMASIDREYQTDFVNGVFAAAERKNMDVCVFNCQGYMNVNVSTSDQGESAIFDLPRLRSFDGIISLRATFADETSLRKAEQVLRELRDRPHVSIDVPTEGAVSILFDDAISVREMTDHVITCHGAKEIVYLSGPLHQMVARTRLRACREATKAHGLELKPENIFEGEWIHGSGRDCAARLMQREEGLPDAILCGNDDMAFGVMEYLHENEIRVPEDVIVTGFDALRESRMRGLTTIRRPIDQAAYWAVEVLDGWADGRMPEEWEIVLPTLPVYSESCGCAEEGEKSRDSIHALRSGFREMENHLLQISMFSGSLASAVDEQDAHEKIDQFVRTLKICELYLCMDPSLTREAWQRPQEYAYPREMLLLYGRRGEHSYPIEMFPVRDLVPAMDEEREKPLALVFCPLYYRERNFGYLAMEMGPATGMALYSVLMLLNGALTSLYLQTSLRSYALQMQEMSVHDIMTGMLNRRGFMDRSPLTMEQARREGKHFVMLSADMDFMKRINDQYGHLTGDQAICRMGRAMEKLQERNLIPVHISGDEFLAYGIAESEQEAAETREAARDAMRKLNEEDPWIVETSASIGVYYAIPQPGDSIDQYLTLADRAMYEEKRRKKEAGRTRG